MKKQIEEFSNQLRAQAEEKQFLRDWLEKLQLQVEKERKLVHQKNLEIK